MLTQITKRADVALPYGDDASALAISKNLVAALKADMLVGTTDMPPGMTLRQAGRKAVVMNVSDFASKGIQPKAAMVSLGLPSGTSRSHVKQLARGVNEGAREYGVHILGGDTNRASDLVVSCFLYGTAKRSNLIRRDRARSGDSVFTSGDFGHQAAGLRVLLGRGKAPKGLRRELVRPALRPEARLALGLALAKTRAATSAIDSSDGLAWSLYEIARASRVGIELQRLPASDLARRFARLNRVSLSDLVLHGGEEYELVFTARKNRLGLLPADLGRSLIHIGRVTEEAGHVAMADGRQIEVRGWDHFAR
jgi:thiamine-monophosphate kinase